MMTVTFPFSRRRCEHRSILLLCAVLVAACGRSPLRSEEPRAARESTRSQESLRTRSATPGRLDPLASSFDSGRYGTLHALVVFEQGGLVFERYARGFDGRLPHTMQSVTKSITALLVGIAIDRGDIPGVHSLLRDLLPKSRLRGIPPSVYGAIRLEDLLTMRAGLEWEEHAVPYGSSDNHLGEMYRRSSDWIGFVLNRPLEHRPGTRFRYNSGAALVLGAVLEAATGTDVEELAGRALFEPLGISTQQWRYSSPRGLAHTGGGLYLAPLDLARIGLLLLNGGEWDGEPVVSRRWIEESVRPRVREVGTVAGHRVAYGYLWWILPEQGERGGGTHRPEVWFARGAEGQFLFVVPRRELVVVVTGGSRGAEETAPVELLVEEILPALQKPAGESA